jgi:hypothetical protein
VVVKKCCAGRLFYSRKDGRTFAEWHFESGEDDAAAGGRSYRHSLEMRIPQVTSVRNQLKRLEKAEELEMRGFDVWKDADPDFPPLKQLHDYERRLAVQH